MSNAPKLKTIDDSLQWARQLSAFLDNNSGPLILSPAVLVLANGANQNVNLTDNVYFEITGPSGGFSIGGFGGAGFGRVIFILNNSGQVMTINFEDAGSQQVNQINTLTGGNVVCTAAILVHGELSNNARWRMFASI